MATQVETNIHLLLATLAQRVSFSLVPGQTIEPDPVHHLTLRPTGAVHVTVKKRYASFSL